MKETKKVLADLEQQGLSDLRSMQKADSDIEDVLAAIIIIGKKLHDICVEKLKSQMYMKTGKEILNYWHFFETSHVYIPIKITNKSLSISW